MARDQKRLDELWRPRQWRHEDQRPQSETLETRWRIHVEAMRAMGREPKSFDEWLNS